MSDAFGMKVLHSQGDLSKNDCCLLFLDFLLVDDFVEKIASLSVLHDEVELLGGFNDFIKLDYKGMPEFFHDFEFAGDSDNVGVLKNQLFLEDFDSNELLGDFMLS
jgi:hypothetical protein